MELQGTHQFKAPLPAVWDALMDPIVLSMALPGGDQLERVGENDYKAAMNVRVGPVQGRFEGQVTLSEVVVRQGYRMKVSGTGAPGFLNGEGTLALTENEEGTLLTYAGDVNVGGRIASVGQRLIDSTAKSIIRQGLKALDEALLSGPSDVPPATDPASATRETSTPSIASSSVTSSTSTLESTSRAAPAPAPRAKAEPPSSAAMGKMAVGIAKDIAKDIVQDLTSDYIPPEKQPQLFAFIGGALAMLLFVVLVRMVQRD